MNEPCLHIERSTRNRLIKRAERMKAKGQSIYSISKTLGVSAATVRGWLEGPAYWQKFNARKRELREAKAKAAKQAKPKRSTS